MFKRIDESPRLARFFEFITTTLAKKRGLPVIIGIVFILISLLLQSVAVFAASPILDLLGVIILHTGILIALIGLLLADALGQ